MPNFHTHWLAAIKALDSVPESIKFIQNGRNAYLEKANSFSAEVRTELNRIRRESDVKGAKNFQATILAKRTKWEGDLRKADYNDITCFSAYILGACGPDFWTLMSEARISPIPDYATLHFDLGHYNRTHRQFEVSVRRVGKKTDLQARVEQSYFLGMATHVAADLIIHQLVNVSAGAYNLLQKKWAHEQGEINPPPPSLFYPDISPALRTIGDNYFLWSTHNKVEHYWDSYVRFRLLGDHPELWGDEPGWGFDQMGLPLADTLMHALYNEPPEITAKGGAHEKMHKKLWDVLREPTTAILLEKPLIIPWVFADRVLSGGGVAPFIYDVVVSKMAGAYPKDLIFKEADDEAQSYQMRGKPYGSTPERSESRKLAYFSSKANKPPYIPPTCWNYLTYVVCPNLDKVKKFGKDVFYDLKALKPFFDCAVRLASAFSGSLASAYQSGDVKKLGNLRGFWNLDTGLGLTVNNRLSDTSREVITRLDFVHALESRFSAGQLDYTRSDPPEYLVQNKIPAAAKGPLPSAWNLKERAFKTYDQGFKRITSVSETVSGAELPRTFLRRIRLGEKATAPVVPEQEAIRKLNLDTLDPSGTFEIFNMMLENVFFGRSLGNPAKRQQQQVPTDREKTLRMAKIKHRLTLEISIPIADLGGLPGERPKGPHEKLGMFFFADSSKSGSNVQPANQEGNADSADWLKKKSKILDYQEQPSSAGHGLQWFTTRLFVNFETDKNMKRLIKPGEWNNVVPYEANKSHYGRNFGIATGRKYVLSPDGSHNFDPTTDYKYHPAVTPTEHVFFTLFPLVKMTDGTCYDVLSKEPVTKAQIKEIKKLDTINLVKIVLFYVLTVDGALQLSDCYLDGIRTRVGTIAPRPKKKQKKSHH